MIYRRTKNIRAVQLLLGRAKVESTVCCFANWWGHQDSNLGPAA